MKRKRPVAKRPRSVANKSVVKPVSNKRFFIEAPYATSLTGDKKARERIISLFEPMTAAALRKVKNVSDMNGNIHRHIAYDAKNKRTKVLVGTPNGSLGQLPIWRVISPSLGFYRAVCLFNNPKVIAGGWKNEEIPWAMYFRHVTTGQVLCLNEFKGCFGFHTSFETVKQVPKTFLRDICHFLDLLLNERCPHPYGDLVAGSVA